MNILFFLIPKHKVEYIFNDYSVRQVLEKLDAHGYTALPMLDKEGHYIDAVSEGDILMYIKHHKELSLFNLEDVDIKEVNIRRRVQCITINSNIDDKHFEKEFYYLLNNDIKDIEVINNTDLKF